LELTYEEKLLIEAIRAINMTPVPVLLGFRSGFYDENEDHKWDNIISILDEYLDEMVEWDLDEKV